jgi:transposase
MTLHQQAAALNQDEIVDLLQSHKELQRQVDWFKQQLFGSKSERRVVEDSASQLTLGASLNPAQSPSSTEPTTAIASHTRRRRNGTSADSSDLRFDSTVPVEVIEIPNPEMVTLTPASYTVVGVKETCRLAQRPGSYVVLRYRRTVIKRKDTGEFCCPPAPPAVLEKSIADVSLLAGLLIDKFSYHLPLYRQHQRLQAAGVQLARSTLTNLVHRTAELLVPIYEAQKESILSSQVLTMDETPIKASRKEKGKMKTGYFWPVFGDQSEIIFPFSPTRAGKVIHDVLGDYSGTLQTDGYEAYASYVASVEGVEHAQCWSHTRRKFIEAEGVEPELVSRGLELIRSLYEVEEQIRAQKLVDEKKLSYRREYSKPHGDEFFVWLRSAMDKHLLLPSSPFTKAAHYALSREKELRVFLVNPDVALDTNHLEREIRPIALGRKNWLFCWTEIGAKHVGVVQSLLRTCRLQGIDAYTYLVDVLQRIDSHPAQDVRELTPRLWKERFAGQSLRSDVDLLRKGAAQALSSTP